MRRQRSRASVERQALRAAAGRALVALGAVLLGFLLSAVQLLPTLELSALSIRSGGLSWREAVSFSLQPRGLLLTLLPSYGENLADRFATPAYGEYVAYVGVAGLLLALLALARWRNDAGRRPLASPWGLAAALALLGFGLALGALQSALLRPGQGRAWLRSVSRPGPLDGALHLRRQRVGRLRRGRAGAVEAGAAALACRTLNGRRRWLAAALALLAVAAVGCAALAGLADRGAVAGGWAGCGRRCDLAGAAAVGWPAAGALAAGRADRRQPGVGAPPPHRARGHHQPAHRARPPVGRRAPGRGRGPHPRPLPSISGITYDPGDLAELEQIFSGRLPQQAIYDLVVASKLQEIVAPNLPLLWRLPAVDGYDGGVLPLRRYVDLQTLFIPAGELAEDGRLREQLEAVPPSRLLRLLGVEHVITDKGFDVWWDDVYYDLELSTRLKPGRGRGRAGG